jgi:nitrate reductase alpha subunit
MRKLLFISILLILVSCTTQKRCNAKFPPIQWVRDSSSNSIREYVEQKDSITYTPADSSVLKALVACNEQGQVVLKELQEYKTGRQVDIPIINLRNNILTAKCTVDSVAVFNRFSKHYKTEVEYSKSDIEKIVRVNYLTEFQKWEIKGFYIASLLLISIGLLFIYKITH